MLKKISILLCSVIMLSAIAGCNTVKGVGEDVEQAGDAIQHAAS